MTRTYVDTHVVVWLRENKLRKFSKAALRELERAETLLVSPVVKLELAYLQEIGGLTISPEKMLDSKTLNFDFEISNMSFAPICEAAQSIAWTRDLFDRLLVAEATIANAKLITADTKIHAHYKKAVW
ncbi:MAG: PIN domain-containing protein [Alphaproteobacteria bacterium]|nr:PIN domain-containing protein [Alphaproteobacteria bacterium]